MVFRESLQTNTVLSSALAVFAATAISGCMGVSEASVDIDSGQVKAVRNAEPKTDLPRLDAPSPAEADGVPLTLVSNDEASRVLASAFGVEVRGTALAARESYLSAPVPGIIEEILVKRGESVKKNQPLVVLDKRGFHLGVQQAQAGLDAAVAQEEQLVTEIARVRELLASDAAPVATLEQLLANQKGARASVRMAEAALGQARKAASDAVVRAPYAGGITEILKQKGENAPSMPPTMLVKIVDTSSLEIQTFLPESEAQNVKVGDEARVRIDSAGVDQKGKVIFVSNSISLGTRSFEVRVQLDNPQGAVKAGAFARVTFQNSDK